MEDNKDLFPKLTNEEMDKICRQNVEEFRTKMAIVIHDIDLPVLDVMRTDQAVLANEIHKKFKDCIEWVQEQLTNL